MNSPSSKDQENNPGFTLELIEALEEVMQWISNWDPDFAEDPEWYDETKPKVLAALSKARGES